MRARGFTLVEMVVAITISAILMGMIAMIMGRPVEAYVEQSRRNELIDTSDRIGRMLGNDLGKALPNSVRILDSGNVKVLQMLEVKDVVIYKDEPPGAVGAVADEGLRFSTPEDRFHVYGRLTANPTLLAIGNGGAQAYDSAVSNGVAASGITVAVTATPGVYSISLTPSFTFNSLSNTNRAFSIDWPVTYVCNLTTERLTRFTEHARDVLMPVDETAAQLNSPGTKSSVVATGVTACALQCSLPAGNPCQRTLTFSATVTRGVAPESDRIVVMRQFGVRNTP